MKRSAGLPLSVGQASVPVRIVIAIMFLLTASLCIGGGVLISSNAAARAIAVLLIVPVGLIGVLAAAFVIAPHSRFGVWLDHFIPRLWNPRIAIATAMTLWLIALLVTWRR